jgi:hypothetical protein
MCGRGSRAHGGSCPAVGPPDLSISRALNQRRPRWQAGISVRPARPPTSFDVLLQSLGTSRGIVAFSIQSRRRVWAGRNRAQTRTERRSAIKNDALPLTSPVFDERRGTCRPFAGTDLVRFDDAACGVYCQSVSCCRPEAPAPRPPRRSSPSATARSAACGGPSCGWPCGHRRCAPGTIGPRRIASGSAESA